MPGPPFYLVGSINVESTEIQFPTGVEVGNVECEEDPEDCCEGSGSGSDSGSGGGSGSGSGSSGGPSGGGGVVVSCCGAVPVPTTLVLTVVGTGCSLSGASAALVFDGVNQWSGIDNRCGLLWVMTCSAGIWSLGAFNGAFACAFTDGEDPATFVVNCGPPFVGTFTAASMSCFGTVCGNCSNVTVVITE